MLAILGDRAGMSSELMNRYTEFADRHLFTRVPRRWSAASRQGPPCDLAGTGGENLTPSRWRLFVFRFARRHPDGEVSPHCITGKAIPPVTAGASDRDETVRPQISDGSRDKHPRSHAEPCVA